MKRLQLNYLANLGHQGGWIGEGATRRNGSCGPIPARGGTEQEHQGEKEVAEKAHRSMLPRAPDEG